MTVNNPMTERPDETGSTPHVILSAHRERTLRRLQGQKTVLLIQADSEFGFAVHDDGSADPPLRFHTTLAVNSDGIPLGVPRIEFDHPDLEQDAERPPEEWRSSRWLRGWRDSSELAAALPGTLTISIMDIEEDIAELFAKRKARDGAELLIRATNGRALTGREDLFSRLFRSPVRGETEVRDFDPSSRHAAISLRWERLDIPVPERKQRHSYAEALRLTAILASEKASPRGVKALEWLLLTSLPVTSQRDAEAVLNFYAMRQRIEEYHRMFDTGCEVQKVADMDAELMDRMLAIYAVCAWRIAALELVTRMAPEQAAEAMYSQPEIAVLLDYADELGLRLPCQGESGETPEISDVSLGEALLLMARLGGYLDRKNDTAPGRQLLWDGYMRMSSGALAMEGIINRGAKSAVYKLSQMRRP